MEKQEIHSNALDLLTKFIASTPDKVANIVNKHKNSKIDGPTYYEYLESIDESSILVECGNRIEVPLEYIRATIPTFDYLIDPPKSNTKRKTNKDSAILQSLYFLNITQLC